MTEIIIITLSTIVVVLLTHRHWQKMIQKKAVNQTAVTVGGEIYYVLPSDSYYKVYLKGCKYDTN